MVKASILAFIALFSFSVSFAGPDDPMTGVFQQVEQEFMIDSDVDFGGKIYYRCDTVEISVKLLLEKMGARDVQVRCYGGIDQFRPVELSSSSLKLQYTVLSSRDSSSARYPTQWTAVSIRSFESCHLLTQVFKQVKGQFELRNITGPSTCFSSNQNFRVQFETLTEKPESTTLE